MRLRHIEVVNAVMLTGSVSGAARLMNVTQPSVSRTLQHAEIGLGFALFVRSRGKLLPTTEALTLYPKIEALFAQLDEVQRLATSLRSAQTHTELRVLTVLALSHDVLPRALQAFRLKHPQVAVNVASLHSAQVVASLALREADIGFIFSATAHPSLLQQALAESRMVCAVPKGMLSERLLKRGYMALGELARVPVVGLDARDPIGVVLAQACRDASVTLSPVVTVQTYHAALAMAHHGLGAALIDGFTARSADLARVDVLRLEPQIPVSVKALRPAGKPDSVAVRALVKCMERALASSD